MYLLTSRGICGTANFKFYVAAFELSIALALKLVLTDGGQIIIISTNFFGAVSILKD